MPAAGTADSDGEVALPFPLVAREREGQELLDAADELDGLRVFEDELLHGRIGAGEVPELLHEEGVLEEANVQDQVGVDGDTVLEAEGDDPRHHPRLLGLSGPEV